MRKRRLTWFGLSCLAMHLSCKDIQVTTRIFPDGSCQRTVACTADSGRVPGNAYPIPRDSTWQSSFVRHFKDSTKTAYQAVKTFRTVAELNDYYQAENDSAFAFHCQIRLEKRFRWFYSYLTFRETWQAYNLFDKVPVTDYVSLQDLREKHNDADEEQNNKLDQWEKRALFAEFFTYVQARLPIGDLTSERLTANKEALFQALMDSTQKQETDDILATCGAVLQTPAVQHLRPVIEACMIEIEKKIEFMSDLENNSYKNVVEMPGLLVSTNSADVQNRQVSWQIDALQFRFQDYEMWATSRVINTWAFLVSGAVGFALLLLLVLALWRQRRR